MKIIINIWGIISIKIFFRYIKDNWVSSILIFISGFFLGGISEISNIRRALLFSEHDLKESLNKFASNKKLYNVMYGNVEYTNNNNGRRNGFQKDLRFSNQYEWRIRINMEILDNNGNIFLPGLNIDLADNLERITIINR